MTGTREHQESGAPTSNGMVGRRGLTAQLDAADPGGIALRKGCSRELLNVYLKQGNGHRRTSIRLEKAYMDGLREIAAERGMTFDNLVSSVDDERQRMAAARQAEEDNDGEDANLSRALRVFVLRYYQDKAALGSAGEGGS